MEFVPWLIVLALFALAMLIPAKHDPAIRLKEKLEEDKE